MDQDAMKMTDRLENIKRIWGGGNSDIHWLITEVEKLRDGSEYWGMNQELTEQIDTLQLEVDELRAALDATTADRMYEQERTIATLREAVESIRQLSRPDAVSWTLEVHRICDKALTATDEVK